MKYAESLNLSLHEVMKDHDDVYMIGQDILDPYGGAFKISRGLSTAFPKRTITTPISEAAMTGVAAGMAIRGLRPVLEIMFGDFLTLCTDQIVNSATKFRWMYNDQVRVPLVIRTPMGGRRGYGPTHSQTLESLFMGVPGLTMIAPSNYHHPGKLLECAILECEDPVLFVENKLLYPQNILKPDSGGKIDNFFVSTLNNAMLPCPTVSLCLDRNITPDVTLISYGGMAPLAVSAALNVFLEEEIVVEVLIPSLIKPIPLDDLLPSIRTSGRVVISEEGVKTGGWGAELASEIHTALFSDLKVPVLRIGAGDSPIGSAPTLEAACLPGIDTIESGIYHVMGVVREC